VRALLEIGGGIYNPALSPQIVISSSQSAVPYTWVLTTNATERPVALAVGGSTYLVPPRRPALDQRNAPSRAERVERRLHNGQRDHIRRAGVRPAEAADALRGADNRHVVHRQQDLRAVPHLHGDADRLGVLHGRGLQRQRISQLLGQHDILLGLHNGLRQPARRDPHRGLQRQLDQRRRPSHGRDRVVHTLWSSSPEAR